MAKSPQQIASNWVAKMGQAQANATAGAQSVTVAPGQAAAAQKANWTQAVMNSADKWANNVAAVPLQSWQQAYIQKGVPRMASGAQQAQSKVAAFHQQLQPFQQNLAATLPPRGPKGTNGGRMMAWMEGMLKFRAAK